MAEEFSFGKTLRTYRKKRKMTQAQLGNLLGKSASTVYGYESNQILPSYDTVCLISTILSVEVEVLLDLKRIVPDPDEKREEYNRFAIEWRETRNEKA